MLKKNKLLTWNISWFNTCPLSRVYIILDDFLFHFHPKTISYYTYMQQYQINFSVPESLQCKTMRFYKFTQNEGVINEEILTNSGTFANLCKHSNKHTSLYNSPLGQHLATIDHFSMYFHREQMYIYNTIQFFISTRIFLLQKKYCPTFNQ